MMPSSRRFRPKVGIPTRPFGGDMLWLDPTQSRLHRGNPTAAFIFKAAADGKTEDEIIDAVLAEYEGDADKIKQETRESLDLFIHEGLLEVIEE
jgi:hypothetical protein